MPEEPHAFIEAIDKILREAGGDVQADGHGERYIEVGSFLGHYGVGQMELDMMRRGTPIELKPGPDGVFRRG